MKFKFLNEENSKVKIKDILKSFQELFSTNRTYFDKHSSGMRKGFTFKTYNKGNYQDPTSQVLDSKNILTDFDKLKTVALTLLKSYGVTVKTEQIKGSKNERLYDRQIPFLWSCMYYKFEGYQTDKDIPTIHLSTTINKTDVDVYIYYDVGQSEVDLGVVLLDAEKEIKSSNGDILPDYVEGSILVDEWGWDQTNVTFFKIVKRSGNVVYVQRLENNNVDYNSRSMTGHTKPTNTFADDKIQRVQLKNGDLGVRVGNSFGKVKTYATLWNGRPVEFTNYA